MNTVCNDNIIYYYILNSQKIITATEIISIVLFLLSVFLFLIHFKRNKENHILRKKFRLLFIILLIAILIPVGLDLSAQYIMNHSDYSMCLEDEELEAIKETDNLKPAEYVEVKKEEEEGNPLEKEEIEVVEDEDYAVDEDNPNLLDITKDDNAFYFLNVGAGSEAFIIQDQGHFGLIDTSYNSKAPYILKQLEMLGAKELDFLIITHAHLDHIGGYSKIMSSIKIKTLYIKNPDNVNSNYVATYHNLIKQAEDEGTTVCDVKDVLCQDLELGTTNLKLYNTEFYNSKGIDGMDRSRVENANSIAVVATINQKKIYFASDIGDYFDNKRETAIAQEVGDIDVYKVAHHGYVSFNNNLEALSYIKPEFNIVTNTRQLSRTFLKRIKNTSPDYQKTYYTTDGTITLHVGLDGSLNFTQIGE